MPLESSGPNWGRIILIGGGLTVGGYFLWKAVKK